MAKHAQEKYLETMKAVWKHVEEQWQVAGKRILGTNGFDAVQMLSVKLSHAPLPIFMYLLGACVLSSNGAVVRLWGVWSPIALWVINVNYSQTRKSGLTKLADKTASVIDERVRTVVLAIFDAKQTKLDASIAPPVAGPSVQDDCDAAESIHASVAAPRRVKRHRICRAASTLAVAETLAEDETVPPAEARVDDVDSGFQYLSTWSVAMLGGTIERTKERCAGDCSQIRKHKELDKLPRLTSSEARAASITEKSAERIACRGGLRGRLWFSQGLVYDEMYEFCQELALLDSQMTARGSGGASSTAGQSINAGWAYRLIQCGRSDFETKCVGAHGGIDAPTVNSML